MTKNINIETIVDTDILKSLEEKIAGALSKRPNQKMITGKHGIELLTEKFQEELKSYNSLHDSLNEIKLSLETKHKAEVPVITAEEILSIRLTMLLKINELCESLYIENSLLVVDVPDIENMYSMIDLYKCLDSGFYIAGRTFLTLTEDDLVDYDNTIVIETILHIVDESITKSNNTRHNLMMNFTSRLSDGSRITSTNPFDVRRHPSILFSELSRMILITLVNTKSIVVKDNSIGEIVFYDKANNIVLHGVKVSILNAPTHLDIYASNNYSTSNHMSGMFEFNILQTEGVVDCSPQTYIGNCIPDELLNPVLKFIEDNKERLMKELKIPEYAMGKTEEHEHMGFGGFAGPPQGLHRLNGDTLKINGACYSLNAPIFGEDSNTNKPITSMNTHSHNIPTQPVPMGKDRLYNK